jgi:hypothetical protein
LDASVDKLAHFVEPPLPTAEDFGPFRGFQCTHFEIAAVADRAVRIAGRYNNPVGTAGVVVVVVVAAAAAVAVGTFVLIHSLVVALCKEGH